MSRRSCPHTSYEAIVPSLFSHNGMEYGERATRADCRAGIFLSVSFLTILLEQFFSFLASSSPFSRLAICVAMSTVVFYLSTALGQGMTAHSVISIFRFRTQSKQQFYFPSSCFFQRMPRPVTRLCPLPCLCTSPQLSGNKDLRYLDRAQRRMYKAG